MSTHALAALPVYNEVNYVDDVLDRVAEYADHILVVDDGSTDGTAERLARRSGITVARHARNRGYGAALMTAFQHAARHEFEVLVTLDCDGQHEPCRIPSFVQACVDQQADIVSGSRYLKAYPGDTVPPEQRRMINQRITAMLNERLGFKLTDAFCGFKAYRVPAVNQLQLTETGYAMPLELWVQAACHRLNVIELPVPLIYLDASRSFGGSLDDAETRMNYYREILDRSFAALPPRCYERLVEEYAG